MLNSLVFLAALTHAHSLAPSQKELEQIAIFSDIRSLFSSTSDGDFENRVGFEYASMVIDENVHGVGDEEPTVPGTQKRIQSFARILQTYPEVRVHIDAHCGVGAPPWLAQDFSEDRAQIVAQALSAHGVQPERISAKGWGKSLTPAALTSSHRNSASAKSGYGWAEMFFLIDSSSTGPQITMPPRADYYAGLLATTPEQNPIVTSAVHVALASSYNTPHSADPMILDLAPTSTYPVFYMDPGTEAGAEVALHFFEPRYRILINRAWKSDKHFIYCAAAPFAAVADGSAFKLSDADGAYLPPKEACVLVKIDDVSFYEDGRADMQGHGVKEVEIRKIFLEAGTGGLFLASISSPCQRTSASGSLSATLSDLPRHHTDDGFMGALMHEALAFVGWLLRHRSGGFEIFGSTSKASSESSAPMIKKTERAARSDAAPTPNTSLEKGLSNYFNPMELFVVACWAMIPILLCIAARRLPLLRLGKEAMHANRLADSDASRHPFLVV